MRTHTPGGRSAATRDGRFARAIGLFVQPALLRRQPDAATPGAIATLRHTQALYDAFVHVPEGTPTLILYADATPLAPILGADFPAGSDKPHSLGGRSDADVLFLESGDRTRDDSAAAQDSGLVGREVDSESRFTHADGTPH